MSLVSQKNEKKKTSRERERWEKHKQVRVIYQHVFPSTKRRFSFDTKKNQKIFLCNCFRRWLIDEAKENSFFFLFFRSRILFPWSWWRSWVISFWRKHFPFFHFLSFLEEKFFKLQFCSKTQIFSFTHSRITRQVEQSHFSFWNSLFFVSFFSKCLFEETLKEELENLNTCSYLCSGNELWVHSITFTICLEKEGRFRTKNGNAFRIKSN